MSGTKVFTLTAETSAGMVTFGLLGRRAWVMVTTAVDGEAITSLDSPQATRIASRWLPKELWPQFAVHLHPDNDMPDAQQQLF